MRRWKAYGGMSFTARIAFCTSRRGRESLALTMVPLAERGEAAGVLAAPELLKASTIPESCGAGAAVGFTGELPRDFGAGLGA
jgi:hypothetical protein